MRCRADARPRRGRRGARARLAVLPPARAARRPAAAARSPTCAPHLRSAAHEGFVLDGRTLVAVRTTLAALRAVGAYLPPPRRAAPRRSSTCPSAWSAFRACEAALRRALDDDGNVLDAGQRRAGARARQHPPPARHADAQARGAGRRGAAWPTSSPTPTSPCATTASSCRCAPRAAGQLPGVVQDRSVSGETLLRRAAVRRRAEQPAAARGARGGADRAAHPHRPHRRWSAPSTPRSRASIDALVEVDCLVAAARFARAYRCTRPTLQRRRRRAARRAPSRPAVHRPAGDADRPRCCRPTGACW